MASLRDLAGKALSGAVGAMPIIGPAFNTARAVRRSFPAPARPSLGPMPGAPQQVRTINTPLGQGPGSPLRNDTYNALAPFPGPEAAGPQFPTLVLPGAEGGGGGGGYDAAFQKSLGSARAGIEAQLRNALGEVARQEAVQQQMIGQLPEQYKALHGQAVGQATQLAQDADAAQDQIGPAPGMSSQTAIAPLLAAMQMAQGTQQAGVPTLSLAAKDSADRQRGGLLEMRMQAMADLDAEERSAMRQRGESGSGNALALAKMQNELALTKYQADMEEQRRKDDLKVTDRHRSEDFDRQLKLSGLKAKPARKFGGREVSVERGAALKQGAKLRMDSSYTKLAERLRGVMPEEVSGVVAEFEKKHKKANPQAMSLALFDLFGEPQAK